MPTSTLLSVNKKAGFTLVELLVVITIIAILSIIGLTLFTTVQKGARDAKRRGDVDAIFKAFEAHYQDGKYDKLVKEWFVGGQVPEDPQGGHYIYSYIKADNGEVFTAKKDPPGNLVTTYTVCAKLENKNGNSSNEGTVTTTGSPVATFTAASGKDALYYCARNVQ